MDYQMGL